MPTKNRLARALALVPLLAGLLIVVPLSVAHADRDLVCVNAPVGTFADVPENSTHASNIDCLAAYGITVGVGGGNYDPGGHVSRGQMASFLVNFTEVATDLPADDPPSVSPFTDIVGTTHETNIDIAAALDITSGRTARTYDPTSEVTRAQMATFVLQAIQAVGAEATEDAPDAFQDDDGSVHEANINALANLEVVKGVDGSAYDPHGEVTRAQMATFLANAAGLLEKHGLWAAAPLPFDGPEIVVVARDGSAADSLEVLWDRSVELDAGGSEFVVTSIDDVDAVATGTAVEHVDGSTTLQLDTDLQADVKYRLHTEEGVAIDEDDLPNTRLSIAFVFSVQVGGGSGGGSDGGGEEPPAPAITSMETDPANNRIVVSFDEEVICPTTQGVAAWFFANGIIEDDDRASETPDSVTQSGAPSTSCALVYSGDGIEVDDFGAMTYTQPADASHRVATPEGGYLESDYVDVLDGVAPTFDGLAAYAAGDTLTLTFSEPILCLSLHSIDLLVEIDGEDDPLSVDGYSCDGTSVNPEVELSAGSLTAADVVTVTVVDDIHDRSEDNVVPHADQATVVI